MLILLAGLMATISVVLLAQAKRAQAASEQIITAKEAQIPQIEETAENTYLAAMHTPNTPRYTETDVQILAKLMYGECRGVKSTQQKAAVVWAVLNRVDSAMFPATIQKVVTQKHQFAGYSAKHPITPELYNIAKDVLARWEREKNGESNVGRVLPKEYVYFTGNGKENVFRASHKSKNKWKWTAKNPYAD